MFFTYILASKRNGAIYTGSTDALYVRTLQHRNGTFGGHTRKHGISMLVWFETHPTRDAAFKRERQIKEWKAPLAAGAHREIQPRLARPVR